MSLLYFLIAYAFYRHKFNQAENLVFCLGIFFSVRVSCITLFAIYASHFQFNSWRETLISHFVILREYLTLTCRYAMVDSGVYESLWSVSTLFQPLEC